ncbi:unnamed protein product [Schistosoma mattheei]|uniref:Uncharacterized protein n=1 Tax=Schistosoma mattheei TaxID=31246 RepID=A0AA85BM30_9TREM|nr:unnamed protein product [Schistosoma mattheei]
MTHGTSLILEYLNAYLSIWTVITDNIQFIYILIGLYIVAVNCSIVLRTMTYTESLHFQSHYYYSHVICNKSKIAQIMISTLIVEFMNQLKIDHHEKPGIT